MTPEQIAAVIARLRQRGSHQIDLHSPGSGHEAEFSPDPLCAEAAAMLTALLTERGALLRVAEAARDLRGIQTSWQQHIEGRAESRGKALDAALAALNPGGTDAG